MIAKKTTFESALTLVLEGVRSWTIKRLGTTALQYLEFAVKKKLLKCVNKQLMYRHTHPFNFSVHYTTVIIE